MFDKLTTFIKKTIVFHKKIAVKTSFRSTGHHFDCVTLKIVRYLLVLEIKIIISLLCIWRPQPCSTQMIEPIY